VGANDVITATAEPSLLAIRPRQDPEPDVEISPGITRNAVIAELEKILASTTFVRSKRLGRFLRFTVEQCLEGRQNALKEYLVGVEVFNKLETFDPRIDSIVRVEARRLRSKLERYYQTEGRDDAIVVQFRKGSYVPMLLRRDQLKALGLADELGVRGAVRSIAIAEFANFGMNDSYAHFCSGLSDDLISALTKVPALRVVARRGGNGDGVNADYILEGSVRKQGERLRIAAQLIDARNHLYIWSETYERDLSDAFAVQDEISRAIVFALRKEFQSVRV
jgi:TolB-like protein